MGLLDEVMDGLGSDGLDSIGKTVGLDQEATAQALTAAIPLLLAGMSRYSERPENVARLHSALSINHDGSILDDVPGFLAGGAGRRAADEAILDDLLGNRRHSAARAVGGASGIDMDQAAQLISLAAPLVLGALGRARRRDDLQPDGLESYLRSEQDILTRRSAGGMSMLKQALDSDGDGSIFDDISAMGDELLDAFRPR